MRTYEKYFTGSGVSEDPNNPGNLNPDTNPPKTTRFPDIAESDCTAAVGRCAGNAAGDPAIYASFDVHYLVSEKQWECTIFYGQNLDSDYFDTEDCNVAAAYGYSQNQK